MRSYTPPGKFFGRMQALVNYRRRPEDPTLYEWNCNDDLRRARWVATELNLPWPELEAWLRNHGGKCDCEVMWNAANYWYLHLTGERCGCGYVGWCHRWNAGQRILNGFMLGSLLLPALFFVGLWMSSLVDQGDPVSILGFMGCFGWMIYASSRLLLFAVDGTVDKTDRTG